MIRFSAVTKHFGGPRPALQDVTFEVGKGEFVFLTGQSGSGKSTLLKIITKEYTPTSGEVEFDSVPLSKLRGSKIHHHRRKIGVVFQDYRLLPELNIWENIALPLEIIGKPRAEIEERVTDLLELVQLVDKAHDFPSQLSGGESQRVGIARALSTAPAVILADEPTGNLDPQTTLMIAKLFNKIHELGTTIFFATHDLSILSTFSHRRLHLDKGLVISDSGKPAVESKPAAEPKPTPPVEPKVEPEKSKATEPTPKPEAVTETKTEEKKADKEPEKTKKVEPKTETKSEKVEEKKEEAEVKAEVKKESTEPKEIPLPKNEAPPKRKTRMSLPKLSLPFSLGKKKKGDEKNPVNMTKTQITEMVIQVETLDDDEEVKSE
jgi:cell division transport system ATP-binding protein